MGIEKTIAPLLRGLTFNGNHGSIVRFDSSENMEGNVFLIPEKIKSCSSDSAVKDFLAASFNKYIEVNGTYPKTAVLFLLKTGLFCSPGRHAGFHGCCVL